MGAGKLVVIITNKSQEAAEEECAVVCMFQLAGVFD